ncbi:hypothetical protein [Gimibacter soli]|uniref:Uncharacterized protein n=1 Tax=Gimibacter soli TaxID=3024400 RepID=A0AAF0BG70_9PROT|nr:hypothetical protein [Gimibacter soli]WCL53248.1 hypothetical protein PH603_11950 [Gimibacter soli]
MTPKPSSFRVSHRATLLAAASLMLAACGGEEDASSAAAAAGANRSAAETRPAAAKPAGDPNALPAPKCPAKTDDGLPGPDILGLKLGMSKDMALNIVRCHLGADAFVDPQRNWIQGLNAHQLELAPQAFMVQQGETSACNFRTFNDMQKCGPGNRVWGHVSEKFTLATPGVPGRETLVGVWRTQNFKPDEMPAVESLVAALTKKYGAPQFRDKRENRRGDLSRLRWITDVSGQPVIDPNPLFRRCGFNIDGRMNALSWSEGCGLNLAVEIMHSPDNPALAKELSVGMLHQDNLFQYGSDLQAELNEIEEGRRAEELERAKKSGSDIAL